MQPDDSTLRKKSKLKTDALFKGTAGLILRQRRAGEKVCSCLVPHIEHWTLPGATPLPTAMFVPS